MEADPKIKRMPHLLMNPQALERIVKKKGARHAAAIRRPLTSEEAQMLPLAWQLSREHLDALREEISSAEPVLNNVYEDIAMFHVREGALNEIMDLLSRMRRAVDRYPFSDREKDLIKNNIDGLVDNIRLIVKHSRYYAIPLLEPMQRAAPFGQTADAGNKVDIVFVLARSESMRRDVKLLAQHAKDFANELANFGLDVRMGLQPFARTSQPAGPFRTTTDEFIQDLGTVHFSGENMNALAAIQNSLDDFSYRIPTHRFLIVFSDHEAHDDFGGKREETLEMLQSSRTTLFALSVNDSFTRMPLFAFEELAEATGGRYLNIEKTDYRNTLSELAEALAEKVMGAGTPVIMSNERTVPIGPDHDDIINIKFPDFRPAALGLTDITLESSEDFKQACKIIEDAISAVSDDVLEKRVLTSYLDRILSHFDSIRSFRLDFRV